MSALEDDITYFRVEISYIYAGNARQNLIIDCPALAFFRDSCKVPAFGYGKNGRFTVDLRAQSSVRPPIHISAILLLSIDARILMLHIATQYLKIRLM